MGGRTIVWQIGGWRFWLLVMLGAALAMGLLFPGPAWASNPLFDDAVVLKRGEAAEQVEGSASYWTDDEAAKLSSTQAYETFKRGAFTRDYKVARSANRDERTLWIALPIAAASSNQGDIRRSVGLGGVFYVRPDVYLVRSEGAPVQILGGEATRAAELLPRKLTYLHSSSFTLSPGEKATVMVNLALIDRPSIGLFREGELGRNQIIGTMLKAGVFLSFVGVGVCLVVLGILTRRRVTMLAAIGLVLAAIQADISLLVTILNPDFESARQAWRISIAFISLSNIYIVMFAFRNRLSMAAHSALRAVIWALPILVIAVLFASKADPYLLLIYYILVLGLVAVIALRLEMARRLRQMVVGIIGLCALIIIAVEPDLVGTVVPELFVGFIRDLCRLIIAATLLVFVVVDIRRSLEDRGRIRLERISALEANAETNRRLLATEREYSRARETAVRRKQQLAAASHDIRQPLVGLRASIRQEADNLSPGLQERLSEAVDYLEELTHEYSDQETTGDTLSDPEAEAYSLELIVQTVEDMFAREAANLGIELRIHTEPCETRLPALALIRSVSNLVANALRHADASAVDLSIQHSGTCCIEVRDNGKGMDEDTVSKVLTRGTKGASSGGDGLGLAIITDLALRHKFEFTLTSAPGEGTIGRIKLPPAR